MRFGNHRIRIGSATAIVVIALAVVALIVWWTGRPSVRSVEREIKTQLPSGSTKMGVISFLDARHIEHSDISVGGKYGARYMPDGRRIETRFISAAIHNPYLLFPAEERIIIIFYFDDDDSLIDYDLRSHQIAP
jgi:hypothetical protein